ncbi:MAG: DNA-binding response regulator [Chloroflexi bacterium]|nr:DNA-binding response regulator [Chloroflexota bacterium]|tara:strand:- start:4059 stop:4757 length:699 start_codon:yes stop_codon:yes gene_type:complete
MKKILVVEDEENILEALKYNISKEGYEFLSASDGDTAISLARQKSPDLIILDVMIPKLDGFEVCRILRKETNIPIFMLTAKTEEIDRVIGLEIGADDYITKPFSMRELLVRIKNVLRRYSSRQIPAKVGVEEIINIGGLKIDSISHSVELNGAEINLKPKEFELLYFLASNSGRVFTRAQLLEHLWGENYYGDIRTVDVHVRWVRQKIESAPSNPRMLKTIRGVGYRFVNGN